MNQPRPEYPRPQLCRSAWCNLNGTWSYQFDPDVTGEVNGLACSKGFSNEISVPFCPESSLSGVGYTAFIPAMWYHRTIEIPQDWKGKRILLHCGGIDYESEVYLDGHSVGNHSGGSTSVTHDITARVEPGQTQHLVIRVRDNIGSGIQPGGKQCREPESHGCWYTRVTGIWQTVWLEPVDLNGLRDLHITPDLDGGRFVVSPRYYASMENGTCQVKVFSGGALVGESVVPAADGIAATVPLKAIHPWSPDEPHLYELRVVVCDADGDVVDEVESYAGLRKIEVSGNRILLNNEPLYLRFVLDQGYYSTGIWTAPTDGDLKRDIELAKAAGFNGARLHQKVFEERYHYWADRLGYLTFAEMPSWGCDYNSIEGGRNFLAEWERMILRDRNHPSIIAWTAWNESGEVTDLAQYRSNVVACYEAAKHLDPKRPVHDASGYTHVRTDIWSIHSYKQDPALFRELLHAPGGVYRNKPELEPAYAGQPYFVAEFGGMKWMPTATSEAQHESWGYGDTPTTIEAYFERLERLVEAILELEHATGYCFTQLTDVEQEHNGVYTYDRQPKFDPTRLCAIFSDEP